MTRTFDPFDELAAMFLTSPSIPSEIGSSLQSATTPHAPKEGGTMFRRPRTHAPASSATIELLIVGHLPVRGGLWLTPYADAVARQSGATALVRLDGDEPSLQLLRAATDLATWPQDKSLNHTIDELGGAVDVWIVRPVATTQSIDLLQIGADRITILSGADEAAMVAAYQQVKDLAQAAQQLGCRLPVVSLAIVGSDSKNAAAVVERFNRTTGSFLDVQVALAMCLPRMDAGIKSTRCMNFSGQPSLADVMQSVRQAKSATAVRRSDASAVAGQLHVDRSESHVMNAEQILKSPLEPAGRSAFRPTPAGANTSPPTTSEQRIVSTSDFDESVAPTIQSTPNALKLIPKPAVRWEPKEPARALEPDDHGQPIPLANHVKGLTPLPIRSPGHERIELAIDGGGRLHLLSREQSLREIPVVEKWTKSHRELIAMACPQHKIDHAAKMVVHIFSSEPVALADLHGSDLHLHVLAPVLVNGQTGWYAAPLNAVTG